MQRLAFRHRAHGRIYAFYHAMRMHKRGICRHPVSVHVSGTFVSCAKTNQDIFEILNIFIHHEW